MLEMESEVAMLTPEKVVLDLAIASLGSRIGAHLIDLMALYGILTLLNALFSVFAIASQGLTQGITIPILVAVPFLYFIVLEGVWRGQTLGKFALKLNVAMADGSPVTFQAAIGRNLLRIADLLPFFYFVGISFIFLTNKSQRLGDLASDTIVVTRKGLSSPVFPAPHHVGIHAYEHYVGDLHKMTVAEYEVLRRLCDRYPELPSDQVQKMVLDIWVPIAHHCEVPENSNVHPLLLAEAVVMKYGRQHGLL